jgi:hypothetical protein
MKLLRIWLIRFCIATAVLSLALSVILALCGIQHNPWVTANIVLSPQDTARIKTLLKRNDPRTLQSGDVRTLAVSERDLNLMVRYGLTAVPRSQHLRAQLHLQPDLLQSRFTMQVPETPLGAYLNAGADLAVSSPHLKLKTLYLGKLALPGWPFAAVLGGIHRYLQRDERYRVFTDSSQYLHALQVQQKKLSLVYQWSQAHAQAVKAQGQMLLFSAADKTRLLAYKAALADLTKRHGRRTSLVTFLPPLFRLAQERSINGDASAENRALLQVLTIYAAKHNIDTLIGPPTKSAYPVPRPVQLTLRGRHDLARHFLISAGLAASSDTQAANAIGLFKEIEDSQGGSGFSFADLAADRAGTTLAERAMAPDTARLMQRRLARTLRENDIMPDIERLPEGMQEVEFQRRFQQRNGGAYRRMMAEIERRITACPVYQSATTEARRRVTATSDRR